MKIGVIGAGNMGSGLGAIWAEAGHEVRFSLSRKTRNLPGPLGTVQAAVESSDILLWAIPRWIWGPTLREAGPLTEKIVIDCTNPYLEDGSGLALGFSISGSEELQQLLPEARIVKAFNTVGANIIHSASREFNGKQPTMFFCGDDAGAKKAVSPLIADAGFEPLDVGPLKTSRSLEMMEPLWRRVSEAEGAREFAFTIVRRKA